MDNATLETIRALVAPDKIWMSIEVTGQSAQYQPVKISAGASVTLPPELAGDAAAVAATQAAIYDALREQIAAQVEDMIALVRGGAAYDSPAPAPQQQHARQAAPAPVAPGERQFVPFLGREAQPGQWTVETAHEFDLTTTAGGKIAIRLWKDGLKFPVATVSEGAPAFPAAWVDAAATGRNRFKAPQFVVMEVGKPKAAGGYYRDVVRITGDESAALSTYGAAVDAADGAEDEPLF